ncbi:MAG: hypothetical protein AB1547_01270 [Thermodesulfobacteriota bacterium]
MGVIPSGHSSPLAVYQAAAGAALSTDAVAVWRAGLGLVYAEARGSGIRTASFRHGLSAYLA